MTLFEKFKELYSCEVDFETFSKKECVNEYDLLVGHYDTETADSMCDISDANFDCCKKCWNQEYIEDYVTDTNVGNKNETTLSKAKLKEIMKQLWLETENVLGHEMVDFYSIERIIRDVLGMDNSEEEK